MRPETVRARPECPEPGRWSAPDDWASEDEVSAFLGELTYLIKPDSVIETGSYLGHTSRDIGRALAELGRGSLVSIERDTTRAEAARMLTNGLPVRVVTGSSLDYMPLEPIDLLFIDSDFPIRIAEIRYFKPWASPRCVIALHDAAIDYYPGSGAMQRDMRIAVSEGVIQPFLQLPTPRGLGLTRYA